MSENAKIAEVSVVASLDSTNSARDDAPASPKAIPPRFWWLKRIGLAAVVYAAFVIGLRVWFGYEAERRLSAAIDGYRTVGQPVLLSDFNRRAVAEKDNAAILLEEAEKAFVDTLNKPVNDPPSGEVALGIYWLSLAVDVTRAHLDEVGALMEANGRALQLVHEARGRSETDWGTRLATPALFTTMGHLNGPRSLAKLLSVAAVYAHARGDDAVAVERLHDLFWLAPRVDAEPAVLINHLVSIALSDIGLSTI